MNLTPAEAYKEIAFGSVAGMVAEVFEYPFDLAKVRLQAQVLYSTEVGSTRTFKGPLHCLYQTWKEEGLRGLYRGVSVPLVGSMAQTAALFLAYSSFQNVIRNFCHEESLYGEQSKPKLTIPQIGVAAAGAGFITSFILTPIELVKCRMQVQMMSIHSPEPQLHPKSSSSSPLITKLFSPTRHTATPTLQIIPSKSSLHNLTTPRTSSPLPSRIFPLSNVHIHTRTLNPPGSLSLIHSIFRDHGLKGFWLGQTGTFFRETGGCAVWFVVKEVVTDALQKRRYETTISEHRSSPHTAKLSMDILPWESATAGAMAGGAATLLFYPADTIKSAIQTEDELRSTSHTARAARPSTFWRAALRMYRSHGPSGFYTGCGMTVARSVPSSGIIFVVYDGLQQWLG